MEGKQKTKCIQLPAQKLSCSLGTGSEAGSIKWGTIQGQKYNRPQSSTHLKDHSGLLQQVGPHVGPDDVVPFVKADLNILSKAAAVVIPSGFGIPDGLESTKNKGGVHKTKSLFQAGCL